MSYLTSSFIMSYLFKIFFSIIFLIFFYICHHLMFLAHADVRVLFLTYIQASLIIIMLSKYFNFNELKTLFNYLSIFYDAAFDYLFTHFPCIFKFAFLKGSESI